MLLWTVSFRLLTHKVRIRAYFSYDCRDDLACWQYSKSTNSCHSYTSLNCSQTLATQNQTPTFDLCQLPNHGTFKFLMPSFIITVCFHMLWADAIMDSMIPASGLMSKNKTQDTVSKKRSFLCKTKSSPFSPVTPELDFPNQQQSQGRNFKWI